MLINNIINKPKKVKDFIRVLNKLLIKVLNIIKKHYKSNLFVHIILH